jgi:hypothetical protein
MLKCDSMKRILLVNPPIYDFTAYDFWLRPYGLLSVGGLFRDKAELLLFDYMDRWGYEGFKSGGGKGVKNRVSKMGRRRYGRGSYRKRRVAKPGVFGDVPRYFYRYGRKREEFREFLKGAGDVDLVLTSAVMTYWYPGLVEVLEDVRELQCGARIAVGGGYASLCGEHCRENIEADLVLEGRGLEELFSFAGIAGVGGYKLPYWEGYEGLTSGAIRLSRGCPCRCSYCSTPILYGGFEVRDLEESLAELEQLVGLGAKDIAFYDDALVYNFDECAGPFFDHMISNGIKVNLHTPNGLHCRYIDRGVAGKMVSAGVKTFYLGYESSSESFQNATGGKTGADELGNAVESLWSAGAKKITAYELLGHPEADFESLVKSLKYANSLGIKVMLSDFSPIPGTRDGEACGDFLNMDEPLEHNKTAFTIRQLGNERVNEIKELCRLLNRSLKKR